MAAAMASPARIPPTSQAMDSASVSPSRPPSESASDASSGEQPDHLRNMILSKITSLQSSSLLRAEEYRQLFGLPSDEVLVQDFNCAIQENILLQGHMYLFEHYICFYANIFGFETKKIIPFQDVTSVRKAKTAGIFPNAIDIVAGGKKYFFASFLSRDEAFKLIVDGWSQCVSGLKGALDQQDSRSETSSQLNGFNAAENGNCSDSQISDLDSDERNMEVSGSEEAKLPPDNEDDNAMVAAPEVPDVVQEKPVAIADVEPSTSSGSVKWIEETQDAPKIPKSYAKVAESRFPIGVKQFFNLFFSDDAIGFVESYHNKCGDKDLRCTSWSPDDKFGYRREKNFQHPIKVYFGAKCGGCKETQKFRVYRNSHLVIETSQEVSDVPYADYFTVEGIWDVRKDGGTSGECCILQVYISVAFSKKTMWKGKIEQSTVEECREAYGTWIQLAHGLLQQKNIEESEVGAAANVHEGDEVDEGNSRNSGKSGGQSERLHSNSDHKSVVNSQPSSEQAGNLFQGNLVDFATILPTLRAVAVKSSSFLRSQGSLRLAVITFSAVLLLMQLSIVLLLSKPQQVLVVPQMESTPSVGLGSGYRAVETIHWIERRMILLKDEMLAVEGQLERMKRERILLKSQLDDLERLKKQWR